MRQWLKKVRVPIFLIAAAGLLAPVAHARFGIAKLFLAELSSRQEVPAILSDAKGFFRAELQDDGSIDWQLRYGELDSEVRFAHIHLGQRGVNGGVLVWLCSNTTDGPSGTASCPEPGGLPLEGTIEASDVQDLSGQGVAAGDIEAVVSAMRSGLTYVNVHSNQFPSGVLRGQIGPFFLSRRDDRRLAR